MRDCKSRKRSTDFIVGLNLYSAKFFSGIKSEVYEIGPMGVNGLADDEAITVQEPVTRCGCRRLSCRCAHHEVIWENVGRPVAPFDLQVGIRWKVIRHFHAQFIVTPEKRPAVHTAYEDVWDPVMVCTLCSRKNTLFRPAIERQILGLPLRILFIIFRFEVPAHTT
jgi:hypothetical protein